MALHGQGACSSRQLPIGDGHVVVSLLCHPAQVIISLQEGRGHVPYRNSLLTMVLRDSLGGWVGGGLVEDLGPHLQH